MVFGVKRKRGINSKQKGNANERECAKWLTKWVGKKFSRVPQSGGARWENSPFMCGDIVCEDIEYDFPFTIETKHLKTIPTKGKLRSNSRVFTIWKQAKADAERADKKPMLILRKDGMPKQSYIVFINFPLDIDPIVYGGGLFGYTTEALEKHTYQNIFDTVKNYK